MNWQKHSKYKGFEISRNIKGNYETKDTTGKHGDYVSEHTTLKDAKIYINQKITYSISAFESEME